MSDVEDGQKIAEMSRRIVDDAAEIDRLKAALLEACDWLEANAADYPAERTRSGLEVIAEWRKLAEGA